LQRLLGSSFLTRLLRGARYGIGAGVLALAVGLGRGILFLLTGGHIQPFSRADTITIGYYVGGFTLAGIWLGAVWPLLRTATRQYLAFAIAGVLLMYMIMLSEGGLRGHDSFDYGLYAFLGTAFGFAAAAGMRRRAS
jgi:hypothetical protein